MTRRIFRAAMTVALAVLLAAMMLIVGVLHGYFQSRTAADLIEKNKRPMDELMSYYQCAIMEVETKFKVLNQEYSLEYDRNPIEGIKTRVKSYDSILRKIRRKNIPMTLEGIEENIRDIAGIRVICSFPDDIY